MIKKTLLSLLLLSLVVITVKAVEDFLGTADEVVGKLPGTDYRPTYRHFSGYLESIDGTFLHYWLFESQRNVSADPLLVWLNGGPGASSLLGALTENGPLLMTIDGKLEHNRYAWNQRASIVYIESPATVGFSYNVNGLIKAGDNYTAEINYAALVSFFRKFPHLRSNDFYVTGESYGGIYVPTLASLVYRRRLVDNFKGIAIGNGVYDWKLLENSLYPFANYHGFVDEPLWNQLLVECCPNEVNIRNCDIFGSNLTKCEELRARIYLPSVVNPYNIYSSCLHSNNRFVFLDQLRSATLEKIKGDKQSSPEEEIESVPCSNDDALREYLRKSEVRQALHIVPEASPWAAISQKVSFIHTRDYPSMEPFIQELFNAGLRILIYNGDIDSVCNFLSNQWFVEQVMSMVPVVKPLKPWLVGTQVAGMYKVFGNGRQLVYATVRGSGHMVPTDKPEEAQVLLNTFLDAKF